MGYFSGIAFELLPLATNQNFSEVGYRAANADVDAAIREGIFVDARHHFEVFGLAEGRRVLANTTEEFLVLKERKLQRIDQFLRDDLPFVRRAHFFDFLTDEFKSQFGITETSAVSGHPYDFDFMDVIENSEWVLDCGAGFRPTYFENVVNFEIVGYPSTDVLGVGEILPFKDASFDAVISNAVLEHVRYPWLCAREILRVLKPGGALLCCVPFLQPVHGYPHHYFNMSAEGLLSLFEDYVDEIQQYVPTSTTPIWALTWMLQRWCADLDDEVRARFIEMKVGELLEPANEYLDRSFVRDLSEKANFELASATVLRCRKRK